jgi:membrane-bound serine protease (ClpP class)
MYWLISAILIFTLFSYPLIGQSKNILVLTLDGTINPATSDYIQQGINKAETINSECIILKLNTPGGLLKSTRVIVTQLLESPIPVIVYVAPPGSQAASAGVFITMAAHISVMAPGTNIGAAHPVTLQGEQDSVMIEKATNDAAAFIRTISEKRERNIEWAEDAVRKSLSITETEAERINVINFIAPNTENLLEQINGMEIQTVEGEKIIDSQNAEIINYDMSFTQNLLNILSDPNIAYILFMIGIYGLLFELYNPGAIFPGVIGGICLILAFYSFHTLPINYAGLALIIFAVILFILEINIISHGVLTIGGIIALVLGSLMLIEEESTLEALAISLEVIIMIAVLTLLFFLFAITLGIKAQKGKVSTGSQGIIDETGVAITDLDPEGEIKVHGEIWRAESIEDIIKSGSRVIVVSLSNLKLKVKPFPPSKEGVKE